MEELEDLKIQVQFLEIALKGPHITEKVRDQAKEIIIKANAYIQELWALNDQSQPNK